MATNPGVLAAVRTQAGKIPPIINVIGVIGALALLVVLVAPAFFRAHQATPPSCAKVEPGANGTAFAIVDAQPRDFRLGATLCVTVNNVVTAEALAKAKEQAQTSFQEWDANRKAYVAALKQPTAPPSPGPSAASLNTLNTLLLGERTEAQKTLATLTAPRQLYLYINGVKFPKPADKPAQAIPAAQIFTFNLTLDHDAASEVSKFWREALAVGIAQGRVEAKIGVGDGIAQPVYFTPPAGEPRRIVLYETVFRLAALIAFAAVLVWLVAICATTGLLRDGEPGTSFSLARVQMMFWFVLVVTGFIYIWVVAGQWKNVLTSSDFILLGIAGVATGAAMAIDLPKGLAATPSRGFLPDIAANAQGEIQIQRIQMILWTVILGLIYFWSFATRLALVEFEANLLALAGIVSGTYVALKTQET